MRIGAVVIALALTACGSDASDPSPPTGAVTVPAGFDVEVLVDGFDGPTQIAFAADGRLLVAELNGGERDGTGRVVAVDLGDSTSRTVLVDDLLTPTGIAVDGDLLWVMEQRRLTARPLVDGVADPAAVTVVADELPFNGRSNGTLTVAAGGGVVFNTSGGEAGDALVPGSGVLWRVESPAGDPKRIATGLKHAYAHAVHPDGRWFVTEITDRRLDGGPPPDEVMVVADGDDFGYPRCIGDRTPVAELGAVAADCASTPPSHALFEPGSTPTSITVSPWSADTLFVALWNAGEVVAIPASPGSSPHVGEPFLTGIDHPQHLLVDGDRLLVVDHTGGRILAVTRRPGP
jgi:glucose/arabinose dehydrogenase